MTSVTLVYEITDKKFYRIRKFVTSEIKSFHTRVVCPRWFTIFLVNSGWVRISYFCVVITLKIIEIFSEGDSNVACAFCH